MPVHVVPEDVDIWFQDEARVGQQGTLSRTWAPKGSRPRLDRQQQFEYAYIFGAICSATQQAVGLIMPLVNTKAMAEHLNLISKEVPEGRHAAIVVDRAAWHTTQKLECPVNISLIPLPATAPELNPIEKVWDWLRQHYLSNRTFKGYEDIVENACNAWNKFAEHTDLILTIGCRAWAKYEN